MNSRSDDATRRSVGDPVARNLWHAIVATPELEPGRRYATRLLGVPIELTAEPQGAFSARSGAQDLPVIERYGYVWTSLGDPAPLFEIPEFDEPDRRILNAGTLQVATSAPRCVENFLDMGHFPYVHTDLLGAEPHTEVRDYQVGTDAGGEIWATECIFYQPKAAANATEGQLTEYTYRVPHPYVAILYKSCAEDPTRSDVIALFLHPVDEETSRAHNFLCMVDSVNTDSGMRHFQQLIFGQDKSILENQLPKRLPLDPRAETPIRADKSSIAYRRHLTELGLQFGVIRSDESLVAG
ncbi:MAG: aromatic ring-hydroxylating dioxygenase subunit alpha [Acidimicrobiia bacterium]|nr:aromatic ring-hydroxylating dioxygenase subunit alpha [Acidimicrobiia bacterium]